MSNINSTIAGIGKGLQTVQNQIAKRSDKAFGTSKAIKVKKLSTHVATEHGIRPIKRAGNAATTGSNRQFALPN